MSVAAGDDYCVAVDDTGKVWGWGICDQAQLGNSSSSSSDKLTKSSDGKLCSFSPLTIMETSGFTEQVGYCHVMSCDLTWYVYRLTQFLYWDGTYQTYLQLVSCIPILQIHCYRISPDSSGDPYGCEVLDVCLTRLKGYYHTSTILRYCRQWQLWDIMARIYAIACQYPQV